MRHLLTLALVLTPLPALAQAPAILPVQGLLTDADGVPIDGTRDVTFSLYDVETGGTALYSQSASIDLANGLFTTYLGSDNSLDLGLFAGDRWLGVTVETDAEMPRFRLGTAPYAAFAATCGDAVTLGGVAPSDYAPANHTHAEYASSAQLAGSGTINAAGNPVDWTELKGVPAGIADGNDANTTYTAGDGITINGSNQVAVDANRIASIAQSACYATEADLTAVLDDNYQATLNASSIVTVNTISTMVVDMPPNLSWNNSVSNGTTEMTVFANAATCSSATRGRVRTIVQNNIGSSPNDSGDSLCFCQRYVDNTPPTPVTTYRWVCLYPQSDGN